MTRSPDWGVPLLAQSQAQPEITHNEALLLVQLAMQGAISELGTPPGSPTEGDSYIIASGATGAWSGKTGKLAIFYGGAWRFLPDVTAAGSDIAIGARHEGLRVWNRADDQMWTWTGAAWQRANATTPRLLARSAVAVTAPANTSENILATVTVPAGAMGPNGELIIWSLWSAISSADNKTKRIRFGGIGGTVHLETASTTQITQSDLRRICNRNDASSQVGGYATSNAFTVSTAALANSAIDTTSAQDIVFTGQKVTAGDTLKLEAYRVDVLYGA